MKQISEEHWNEIGDPETLAVLPIYPSEIEKNTSISFSDDFEDGLGRCQVALIQIQDFIYLLTAYPDGPAECHFITVKVRSFEPNSEIALSNILNKLNINRNRLIWEGENIGPARWILYRLDDNGNEIEIYRFLNERSAKWVQSKYEKKGHNQCYFVKHVT